MTAVLNAGCGEGSDAGVHDADVDITSQRKAVAADARDSDVGEGDVGESESEHAMVATSANTQLRMRTITSVDTGASVYRSTIQMSCQ
jgi:hypothetical protein